MMELDGFLMECEVTETNDTLVAKFYDRRYFMKLEEILVTRLPVAVRTRDGVRLMTLSRLQTWRPTGAMTAHFRVVH